MLLVISSTVLFLDVSQSLAVALLPPFAPEPAG